MGGTYISLKAPLATAAKEPHPSHFSQQQLARRGTAKMKQKSEPVLIEPEAIEAANFATTHSCCAGSVVPYRNLQKARLAFQARDINATRCVLTICTLREAALYIFPFRQGEQEPFLFKIFLRCVCRAAHQHHDYSELLCEHNETHKQTSSDYLKAIVFGGLDGETSVL